MDPVSFHYPAVITGAVVAFLLGGLWYSPILFGKAWQRETGMTDERAREGNLARTFGLTLIATLVMAFNLAAFIGPKASLGFGVFAGAAAGVGWVAMSIGVIYLFEQRSLRLWAIDSGYQVLAYTVMGGIVGAWK